MVYVFIAISFMYSLRTNAGKPQTKCKMFLEIMFSETESSINACLCVSAAYACVYVQTYVRSTIIQIRISLK
jgi:hypothetical protein